MDLDMDLDIELDYVEDPDHLKLESIKNQEIDTYSDQVDVKPILDIPNDNSGPNSLDPVPNKIYIRGLENLTSNDIDTYVASYLNLYKPTHIEWIDDLSANLVFPSSDIALDALKSLSVHKGLNFKSIPVLQTIKAKPFPQHPEASFEIRLAVSGDKKQVGARERSRFYLLNPEYDPALGGKRTNSRLTRKYRHRNEGGHRIQKYDCREQQMRDRKLDSDSRLHDRAKLPILNHVRTRRHEKIRESLLTLEPKGSDLQQSCSKKVEKELFPNHEDSSRGRLRHPSNSPTANDNDIWKEISHTTSSGSPRQANTSNHSKIQERDGNNAIELFPQTQSNQRHSILDDIDHSVDLLPMSSVFMLRKGSESDYLSRNHDFTLKPTKRNADSSKEISIRGLAKDLPPTTKGFAIKGASSSLSSKELFPYSNPNNIRRDLFERKIDGRPHRKKMVKDLFL